MNLRCGESGHSIPPGHNDWFMNRHMTQFSVTVLRLGNTVTNVGDGEVNGRAEIFLLSLLICLHAENTGAQDKHSIYICSANAKEVTLC